MVQTGKYYEAIVEMLNNFRSEVQTFSSLGLVNINKHSENFMKRVLNITYGYELENLNKEKLNYPGLDLGERGEGIAFQITSTRTSEKVDATLAMCLKHKHYDVFKKINIFILTSKQSSYTIQTVTEPNFTFTADENILDFKDLLKEIEHLDPIKMKALHDYIQTELRPTIELIKNDGGNEIKKLIDVNAVLATVRLPNFSFWRSKVVIKNTSLSVPDVFSKLNDYLNTPALKNQFLSILNPSLRKTSSTKEILYQQDVIPSGASNIGYGNALLLENSSITYERAIYSDQKILNNLLPEMVALITKILFFHKHSKGQFELEISIYLESNTEVHFYPVRSLVMDSVLNSFILESPFELKETLTDVETPTLADLLQKIMYGFVAHESSFISNNPFLDIDRTATEFVINNIKGTLTGHIK